MSKIDTKIPKWVLGYIHPDDLSSFNESLQESLNNLSLWYHKYRVKLREMAKNGTR